MQSFYTLNKPAIDAATQTDAITVSVTDNLKPGTAIPALFLAANRKRIARILKRQAAIAA